MVDNSWWWNGCLWLVIHNDDYWRWIVVDASSWSLMVNHFGWQFFADVVAMTTVHHPNFRGCWAGVDDRPVLQQLSHWKLWIWSRGFSMNFHHIFLMFAKNTSTASVCFWLSQRLINESKMNLGNFFNQYWPWTHHPSTICQPTILKWNGDLIELFLGETTVASKKFIMETFLLLLK